MSTKHLLTFTGSALSLFHHEMYPPFHDLLTFTGSSLSLFHHEMYPPFHDGIRCFRFSWPFLSVYIITYQERILLLISNTILLQQQKTQEVDYEFLLKHIEVYLYWLNVQIYMRLCFMLRFICFNMNWYARLFYVQIYMRLFFMFIFICF